MSKLGMTEPGIKGRSEGKVRYTHKKPKLHNTL